MDTFGFDEARQRLSVLMDRAAAGEEIVIAKDDGALIKLVPVHQDKKERTFTNALGVTYLADDFDAPLPEGVLKDFGIER